MRLAAAILAFVFASAFGAVAAPWKLDKDHVHVTFTVDNLGFSTTQGQFREFDAQIDFDPDDVESSSVTFTLMAESVDTNSKARDRHVRSKQFLDVKNYPEIRFVSTKVRITDTDTAEITGDFTMKGHTQEEVFTAQLVRLAPSPFDASTNIAGFVVEGELVRTDYGVNYGAPAIGVRIPIRIDIQMSPDG